MGSRKSTAGLHLTVGVDDEDLWRHRAEPITVTINVATILNEQAGLGAQGEYDEAEAEIERRREELGLPVID